MARKIGKCLQNQLIEVVRDNFMVDPCVLDMIDCIMLDELFGLAEQRHHAEILSAYGDSRRSQISHTPVISRRSGARAVLFPFMADQTSPAGLTCPN